MNEAVRRSRVGLLAAALLLCACHSRAQVVTAPNQIQLDVRFTNVSPPIVSYLNPILASTQFVRHFIKVASQLISAHRQSRETRTQQVSTGTLFSWAYLWLISIGTFPNPLTNYLHHVIETIIFSAITLRPN